LCCGFLSELVKLLNRLITFRRDAIDWEEFDLKYQRQSTQTIPFHREFSHELKKWWQRFSITAFLISLFPITKWLPKYNIKTDLFPDFIAGITISILHIPQGIAYSLLAGLEAVNGLYISFFPALIYTFMGTSRHISIGSFAVASLMLHNTASKLGAVPFRIPIINETTNETIHTNWPPTQLEALTTVCITTGLIQIAMGSLCLGSLSLILSDHLVSGFSTAVAFHVSTSQINSILGLSLPNQPSGPFKLIYNWIEIVKSIHKTNVSTLIFSLIMISILVIFKEWAEPRIKKRFSFPIPIDLLVVIFSTLSAWIIDVNHKYQVVVIGSVPTGLPDPTIPRLDFVGDILIDCVIIGVVTFAVSLSLAKIYAKKHKYDIDPNQELIALGSANVFSSFFLAYPASAALSRSTIQEKIGGKTQIAGIFSCLVILCVLLLLAPFLYHLPKCTLACIILVALKTMFMQIGDFKRIWLVSKLDATAWMVTFLSVIFLDVDLGLIVGICISILVILIRLVKPTYSLLGCLPSTEIYVDIKNWWRNPSPSCTPNELIDIITKPNGGYYVVPTEPFNEVFPRLYISDGTTALCLSLLRRMGITHVLNASWGKDKSFCLVNTSQEFYKSSDIDFLGVEALDISIYPLYKHFGKSAEFIHEGLIGGGKVLVHCGEGISRSATLVLAYLMIKCGYTAQEAVAHVRTHRSIFPNIGFLRQLCELNDQLNHKKS
ncbi:unnamed protein product, partial [Medioppia subpectinata]